jgi:hypothetical protein
VVAPKCELSSTGAGLIGNHEQLEAGNLQLPERRRSAGISTTHSTSPT